jgi:hypothetical protein
MDRLELDILNDELQQVATGNKLTTTVPEFKVTPLHL